MSSEPAKNRGEMQKDKHLDDRQSTDAAFTEDPENGSSELATDVQRLSDELKSANDRVLRAQAEFENFRKRMRREMDEERRYAAMALVSELLPVIDNLDRAIESSEASDNNSGLLQGVKMVQTQFLSALEKHQCRRLGVVGEVFDPSKHQAIAQEASDQHPAGLVTRVALPGYQLHDRIVRPAQVFVSTGPAAGG